MKQEPRKDGISNQFWNDLVVPTVHRIKGHKCECCSATKYLDVHHTSYDIVNINTLKLVCRSCHKLIHKGKIILLEES